MANSANSAPATVVPPKRTSALQKAAYNTFRILFLLVVISRIYSVLISYEIVPNYPDPVLAFLASAYARFNAIIEKGSISAVSDKDATFEQPEDLISTIKALRVPGMLIGNLVFGAMLRYYAPRRSATSSTETDPSSTPSDALSKKKAKKQQGSLLQQVQAEQEEESKTVTKKPSKEEAKARETTQKRYIIIIGRLAQCVIFMYSELTGEKLAGDVHIAGFRAQHVRRVLDTLISVVITWAELNGVPWDGGLFEQLFSLVRRADVEEAKAVVENAGAKVKLR